MKQSLLVSVLALTICACAAGPTTAAPDNDASAALESTIAQAEKEIAAANATGFLWRDTEKFLKEAKDLQKEGKSEDALKLAKKALKQAQLAQQQAKDNADAKPHY